jgi:hypothetical protein
MNGDVVISKQRRWACRERVCWQIAEIRQDPRANEDRIPVEQEKETKLKGFYVHLELYGAPVEQQIE